MTPGSRSIPEHGAPPDASVLARDSRTLWAYSQFRQSDRATAIGDRVSEVVLNLLDRDEHVEAFADAAVRPGQQGHGMEFLKRESRTLLLAVRTVRSWFFVDRHKATVISVPGPADGTWSAMIGPDPRWPDSGRVTTLVTPDGRPIGVKIFGVEFDDFAVLLSGAAEVIERLPEVPGVPALPDLGSTPVAVPPAERLLPADWRTAERIAQLHMHTLGFTDAQLTSDGHDAGVDVTASDGVAQVKMQALPVGAPMVQQLRGARPSVKHHLFYATSGYTIAAMAAADIARVGLFRIAPDGSVAAINEAARMLHLTGAEHGRPQEALAAYMRAVRDRIEQARATVASTDVQDRELFDGHAQRAGSYLWRAVSNVSSEQHFASARSAAIFHHHSELLAHVWFREFTVPYPHGDTESAPETDTLDDYYGGHDGNSRR